MAKINAFGATEVARIKCKSTFDHDFLYVLCSDGRVLWRASKNAGSRYLVRGRVRDPKDRTEAFLREIVRRDAMTIIS
jgi:hypothetical protein